MTKTDLKIFLRTMAFLKPYALVYGFGMLFFSGQSFLFPFLTGFFMGGVTEGIMAMDTGMVFAALRQSLILLGVFMFLIGAGVIMSMLTATYATGDMQFKLFRAYIKNEGNAHSGDGLALITTDVSTASSLYQWALNSFLMNLLATVASGVTIFIIDWRMGIGALLVGGGAFLAQARFVKPVANIGKATLEANAGTVKALTNIFSGGLTIRALSMQPQALVAFDEENGKIKKLQFKRAVIEMWQSLFTTVQGWVTLVLVFAFGGILVANGHMTIAQLLMVLPLAEAAGRGMSNIGSSFARLQQPLVAAKRVFALMDANPETPEVPLKNWNQDSTITMKNVDFAYKNAEKNALNQVSLTIKPNQMVAFVGASGSGKTTIMRLIMGMYEREGVDITLGNMQLDAANAHHWRNYFAYVDQNCKLFDMSIGDNIRLGSPETRPVEAAARQAQAHDFITALPQGYDTPCGEKGSTLSGGQRQRIAIARALYRQAPVLVFDEATSALDPETERNMMATIETLRPNHTILLTTHNLQNAKTADLIVVMEAGRIAQMGTHEALLAQGGAYVQLLNA